MTLPTATRTESEPAGGPCGFIRTGAPREETLSQVLLEQLDYLIRFADQESDRLERVRAILMETFN